MEKKLIGYIKDFELVDLLGFARIVGAEEQEDFEDFVVEVVEKYLELPRKDRRNLLKIAKQISENNREYDELKAQGKIEPVGKNRDKEIMITAENSIFTLPNDAAPRNEGME